MSFESEIKNYITKFCVVGNSTVEVKKCKGKIIDSFDQVFRFNDFSLKFKNDYGSRVNVWIRATNDAVIETLKEKNEMNFDLIIYRNFNEKNKDSRLFLESKNINFLRLPSNYEIELSKEIKSIPSTGLLFLYFLKINNYSLNDKNIFGFSFFDPSEKEKYNNYHYFKINQEIAQGITLAKHNWLKEKQYFLKHILEIK